jgi:hypothetical protein
LAHMPRGVRSKSAWLRTRLGCIFFMVDLGFAVEGRRLGRREQQLMPALYLPSAGLVM